MEEWRAIEGYPSYEVSSDGRVRSVDFTLTRKSRWGGMSVVSISGRVLRAHPAGKGYLQVNLGAGAKNRKYVHRLLATAFCPRGEGKTDVNHKNGDKLDNRLENLEWVSKSENGQHAYTVLGCRGGQFAPSVDGERRRYGFGARAL